MKKFPVVLAAAAMLFIAAPAIAAPVCLDADNIQSRPSPDGKVIDFHMRDGSVWRNTLQRPCPGLRFDGFSWTLDGTHNVCENEQIIHVLHTGEICSLGKFEKIVPARHG
jgi:hypothetical protein